MASDANGRCARSRAAPLTNSSSAWASAGPTTGCPRSEWPHARGCGPWPKRPSRAWWPTSWAPPWPTGTRGAGWATGAGDPARHGLHPVGGGPAQATAAVVFDRIDDGAAVAARSHLIARCLARRTGAGSGPGVGRARACRSLLRGKATRFTGCVWQWTDKRCGEGHCKPTVGSRELSVRSSFLDDLRSASMDSSAVVRRVAGEMLIGEPSGAGAACRALARRLAADASASVAERAEFPLKALDPAGTAS